MGILPELFSKKIFAKDGSVMGDGRHGLSVTSLSVDASGHEHKGKGEGGGQFTSHGEKATALAGKHADLKAKHAELKKAMESHKKERLAAFREVRADSEAAEMKADEHGDSLEHSMNNIGWDTDNTDEQPFTDLETLIREYDRDATVGERFSALKQIEHTAKIALAVKQKVESPEVQERVKKIQSLSEEWTATHKRVESFIEKRKALEKAGDKVAAEAFVSQHRQDALKAHDAAAELRKQIDTLNGQDMSGFSPEQIAENKQRLTDIITNARASRQQLKIYVAHRKEMKAIKEGSPSDVQLSMASANDRDADAEINDV